MATYDYQMASDDDMPYRWRWDIESSAWVKCYYTEPVYSLPEGVTTITVTIKKYVEVNDDTLNT